MSSFSTQLHDKNIWIAGAGKSGIGAAKLLQKMGADPFVTDVGEISEANKKILDGLHIEFEEKNHSFDRFVRECDLLVLSPTIPLNKGLAWVAKQQGIPVVSEIELTAWFLPPQSTCIGITGTNGKSTTTNYLAQLFNFHPKFYKSVACGNIGMPFSETLLKDIVPNAFVVELSSYQLETIYTFRPQASILLNLQLDHQTRYGNLDEYLKAKWRLALLTANSGVVVMDSKLLEHGLRLGLPLPRCEVLVFSPDKNIIQSNRNSFSSFLSQAQTLPVAIYGELKSLSAQEIFSPAKLGHIHYRFNQNQGVECEIATADSTWSFEIKNPCLPGEHNVQNLLAASAAALYLGVPLEAIKSQWEKGSSKYEHIPHRLEVICSENIKVLDSSSTEKNLTIVNDSKATNVESALVAIKSYSKPIRLLVGGEPKGESFVPLAQFSGSRVVKYYPFGKAGREIFQTLIENAVNNIAEPQTSLFKAASLAIDDASPNDIILLSPACASFDEFENFEDRGNRFRKWVMEQQRGVTFDNEHRN